MKKSKDNIIIPVFSIIMAWAILSVFLYRPLWFDEALTLTNFVQGKNLSQIYKNYIIPNNQIIYTMSLSLWTQITDFLNINFDFGSRLLSAVFSCAALVALYFGFKRQFGGKSGIFFIFSGGK